MTVPLRFFLDTLEINYKTYVALRLYLVHQYNIMSRFEGSVYDAIKGLFKYIIRDTVGGRGRQSVTNTF